MSYFYRCYVFSAEQEKFLANCKYKINRFACYKYLAGKTKPQTTAVKLSKHRQLIVFAGQLAVSEVELSKVWELDRKTVSKLIKEMESLGMFTTRRLAETTVITMHCLSAWYIAGDLIKNSFYVKPVKKGEQQIKPQIPEPKILTT